MKKCKLISICILSFMILIPIHQTSQLSSDIDISYNIKTIQIQKNFNTVHFDTYSDGLVLRVDECNFNMMRPSKPTIPCYIITYELPFGSIIDTIEYTHGMIQEIPIFGTLSFDHGSPFDSLLYLHNRYSSFDDTVSLYPEEWVTYHTGGGLNGEEYKTYFTLRIYPARYNSIKDLIEFIDHIDITIHYFEPTQPLLVDPNIYDLLIISPQEFTPYLTSLVEHKNSKGIKTVLIDINEISTRMFWNGRDTAEKIKYFIKSSIEQWGVSHVLLVGGRKGQTNTWHLPVRYSYVVPPDEQEYAEQKFLSDLYFADVYTSSGDFSSWDSNKDNKFSVWNETYQDEMDLYPDVYLGRLPCRNNFEVKYLVNKIIQYEETKADDSWFLNLVLVAGDSYVNDGEDINEGETIAEKAIELMPQFNPLKVYASIDDINRETVNAAMDQGAGFAFFCGHGSASSWSTHFPPATNDLDNWTTGYEVEDMIYLKNKQKQPITIVGGCHNGQFDITIPQSIKQGIKVQGLQYFLKRFWFDGWVGNCWAWWLTSKANGGAIATIANTGLGTHGEEDTDHNGIIDYLEVLDGWLELRFLELFGIYHQKNLGRNHGQTISEYLHLFLGNIEKMDTKMVQQWQLFGDPSLHIGGYE